MLKAEAKVARLQRTVLALSSLVEQPTIDPALGLTESIKAVLRSVAPGGLFPTTIRIKLEEAGFDFSSSKNPMASIHAILKRLVDKGVVEIGTKNKDGKPAYHWMLSGDADDPDAFMKTFYQEIDPADLVKRTVITLPPQPLFPEARKGTSRKSGRNKKQ